MSVNASGGPCCSKMSRVIPPPKAEMNPRPITPTKSNWYARFCLASMAPPIAPAKTPAKSISENSDDVSIGIGVNSAPRLVRDRTAPLDEQHVFQLVQIRLYAKSQIRVGLNCHLDAPNGRIVLRAIRRQPMDLESAPVEQRQHARQCLPGSSCV